MPAPSPSCYAHTDPARYPSDGDDATWALIAPSLARVPGRGRPRVHPDRVIYDAILYVLRGGIPWRMLPDSFPPWRTV